jgi:hypothetical protein
MRLNVAATGGSTDETSRVQRITDAERGSGNRPNVPQGQHVQALLNGLRILNAQEVALALDCDIDTVNRRAASGDLPGIKIGRSWAFPIQALEDCLNEMARLQMKTRKGPVKSPRAYGRMGRSAPSLD